MKNQKGYALLIVLGTIVIIGLLVPPLVFQILSSSTQANKTEQNIQLDNMYDMGKQLGRRHVEAAFEGALEYGGGYDAYIQAYITDQMNNDDTIENESEVVITWGNVENYFQDALNGVSLDIDNLNFEKYTGRMEVKFSDINKPDDENRLEIAYDLTPTIDGEEKESIRETFYLDLEGQGGSGNEVPDWLDDSGDIREKLFDEVETEELDLSNIAIIQSKLYKGGAKWKGGGNVDSIDSEGDIGFQGGTLNINSNSGFEKMYVKGDLYLSNVTVDMSHNKKLIVEGNAYFNNVTFINKEVGNDVNFILIYGDIYTSENHDFSEASYKDFESRTNGSNKDIEDSIINYGIFFLGNRIDNANGENGSIGDLRNLDLRGTSGD